MCDGLFHQNVDAAFKQCTSNFGVGRRGNCNHGGVNFASQFRGCCVDWATVLRASSSRAIGVAIDDARQLGVLRFAENP
jgi:hypothetical protein